jgi:outer membrane beta-barrel protein
MMKRFVVGGALLIAIAALVPSLALAQGNKPKPKPPPTAPTGTGAGTDIEIDDPNQPKPPGTDTPPPAGTDQPPASGGICEIDPTAPGCKGGDTNLAAAAKREVAAEVYAVQQIYALRYHRFEVNPFWSFSLNDQFVSHLGPGIGINYYITNVLAVGLNGTFYQPFNSDSDFNFQNRRATRVAVPLTEYQWGANLNFTYVPMYGKFAGFSNFIFHYDAYVVGGVGALSTRPIPVIDPDNRNFSFKPKVAFNAGLGLRIFFNRWLALNLELRDYIYNEQLENLTIATTQKDQQDSGTWFGENRITNAVQAQLGVAIFFPFSWEYRLPK